MTGVDKAPAPHLRPGTDVYSWQTPSGTDVYSAGKALRRRYVVTAREDRIPPLSLRLVR